MDISSWKRTFPTWKPSFSDRQFNVGDIIYFISMENSRKFRQRQHLNMQKPTKNSQKMPEIEFSHESLGHLLQLLGGGIFHGDSCETLKQIFISISGPSCEDPGKSLTASSSLDLLGDQFLLHIL